ncbi:hypothetical protein AKO1_010994 [Acrasis kona]|uniref:Uncharacterized protein n=1 Tax=Acrasis kona TaxID=1008807 RepID=A0AAW2YRR3_9EUKA
MFPYGNISGTQKDVKAISKASISQMVQRRGVHKGLATNKSVGWSSKDCGEPDRLAIYPSFPTRIFFNYKESLNKNRKWELKDDIVQSIENEKKEKDKIRSERLVRNRKIKKEEYKESLKDQKRKQVVRASISKNEIIEESSAPEPPTPKVGWSLGKSSYSGTRYSNEEGLVVIVPHTNNVIRGLYSRQGENNYWSARWGDDAETHRRFVKQEANKLVKGSCPESYLM